MRGEETPAGCAPSVAPPGQSERQRLPKFIPLLTPKVLFFFDTSSAAIVPPDPGPVLPSRSFTCFIRPSPAPVDLLPRSANGPV